jgi:GGDEF domain-containing protein
MTLSGNVPVEADAIFQVVGRVVGVQLESLQSRRIEEARRRFETIVRQSGLAAERIALQLVGELAKVTGASGGSLTLVTNGDTRRIVSFGPAAEDPTVVPGDTWVMNGERFVCGLALGLQQRAVLELRPVPGTRFTAHAADVTVTCAQVLQTWLVGAVSSFNDPMDALNAPAPAVAAFEKRIEEELERAKRFDLHLSLVLVDVSAPSDAVAQIQEALRRELRGSDLLGTTRGRQVAALLTHTDDRGLDNVIHRLRRRLADAADRLNISDVKLGQAALSPDCRTADALLSRAVREAELIVVH